MIRGSVLRRTQWWTLAGGVVATVVTAFTGSGGAAGCSGMPAGIMVGAVWAALNLRALEGLLASAIGPRDVKRPFVPVFLWSSLKLGIYVGAVWLLISGPFPAVSLVVGLTIMPAALVIAGVTGRDDRPAPQPRTVSGTTPER